MKTWLKMLAALPALCLAPLPMLAQQQDASQQQTGDPVADAARKTRDDKKTAAKPKKVYTEDDISRSHPDSASPSGSPGAADASGNAQGTGDNAAAGVAGDEKKDAKKDDEASWRKRFKEMHKRISDAEKELDILQREGQKSQLQYYPDPQKALSQQYDRKDVNETLAKIDAKKAEIEKLKQGLSDMEEALRKAGGDPGWANE